MSKIMIAALLAASVICSSCNRTTEPVTRTENANRTEEAAPKARTANATLVNIVLTGLMVLHQDRAKGTYEVGVIPATDHGHEFKMIVDHKEQALPTSQNLTIEVTNSSATATMPDAKGHSGRRPDDMNGQWDFDWAIDFEGDEFHKHELTFKRDAVLNPIIHLPNGRLYTLYKSIDLQRNQGGNTFADFGFVPEGIAIGLELGPNQQLVLKDDSGSSSPKVLVKPSPGQHVVRIANVPDKLSTESDFHLYYDLLFAVDKPEQFDFRPNESTQKYVPYNPHPDYPGQGLHIDTCCLMECSVVFLSKRTAPLKQLH